MLTFSAFHILQRFYRKQFLCTIKSEKVELEVNQKEGDNPPYLGSIIVHEQKL